MIVQNVFLPNEEVNENGSGEEEAFVFGLSAKKKNEVAKDA